MLVDTFGAYSSAPKFSWKSHAQKDLRIVNRRRRTSAIRQPRAAAIQAKWDGALTQRRSRADSFWIALFGHAQPRIFTNPWSELFLNGLHCADTHRYTDYVMD